MKKEAKPLPTYISQAPMGKETGAFLIDALLALAVGMLMNYTLGANVLAPAQGFYETRAEYYDLAVSSGLYVAQDGGTPSNLTFDGEGNALYSHWEDAQEIVWNYYYVLCAQQSETSKFELTGFKTKVDVSDPNYLVEAGKYIYKTVYSIEGTDVADGQWFTVPTDAEGNPNYTLAPVPSPAVADRLASPDVEDVKAANKDLFEAYMGADGNGASGYYFNACTHLLAQDVMVEYSNRLSTVSYIASLPSILTPILVFFLILPCCLKRGKTLGKLIMRLSVIGSDGYQCSKGRTILHAVFMMFPFTMLLLPFNQFLTFLLFGVMVFISFIVKMMGRNHLSIHDMLTHTMVIDDKTTEAIFDDEQEEKEYAATHDDTLARLIKGDNGLVSDTSDVSASLASIGVLDSRTIGAARATAATITSFDEFETRNGGEQPVLPPMIEEESETDTEEPLEEDPSMKDMMALEGLTEDDIPDEEGNLPSKDEPKEEEDPNSDEFMDAK